MTFQTPGTPHGYESRVCSRAILIEASDVNAIYEAGGELQGTADLRGHWGMRSAWRILKRAERKLARRGATHFLYRQDGMETWNVTHPGAVSAQCGQYGCRSVYRPPSTTTRSRRVVQVFRFRVHPGYWGRLPPHLRPD